MEEVERDRITIRPFDPTQVNPNSYNYTLHATVLRLVSLEIDLRKSEQYEEMEIPAQGLVLLPGECYLACTAETFGSNFYASLITGRSSVGRKFITNHVTAGLIDVGFTGHITLEVTVQRPTRVYTGIPFGQIFWFTVAGDAMPTYYGKYQNQSGPTASRLHLGFKETLGP